MAVIEICEIISFTLNFGQKYKKSNRNHYILLYTLKFTLDELKLKNLKLLKYLSRFLAQ